MNYAPLTSLEKTCAFNAAYRESWRRYLHTYSQEEINDKTYDLIGNMDDLSQQICKFHLDIIPHAFPHPILGELLHTEGLEERLLYTDIKKSLRSFGFFGRETHLAAKIREDLNFPEPVLYEMLTGCGLDYIRDIARAAIKKRTVIDAGAYIGDSARFFQVRYKAGRIFAIEPDAQNISLLRELVRQWGAEKEIIPIQAATGKESGTMDLWGQGVGTSSIMKSGEALENSRRAKMISIDNMVDEYHVRNVGLIKLDVEGAEYDTIIGAEKTIRAQLPVLVISIYHTAKDFFEIKPLIESWNLGYEFMIRKLTPDLIKEVVLIAHPKQVKDA